MTFLIDKYSHCYATLSSVHVARVEEARNVCRALFGEPEEKFLLERREAWMVG
jgi:hypothetical protein